MMRTCSSLAAMPDLESLDLSHTRITDEGMLRLKDAPKISDLNLFYAEWITDQGMTAIRDWKHLKRLNVRGTTNIRRHAGNRRRLELVWKLWILRIPQ